MRFIPLLLLVFFIPYYSQSQVVYNSTDAKAIKYYEKGLNAYNKKEDDNALKYLNSAIERDPQFYDAWDLLSRLYYEKGDSKSSLEALYKMVEIFPKRRYSDWYYIAMFEQENQAYEKALFAFDQYLSFRDDNLDRVQQAIRAKEDCEFAQWATQNPVPYDPVNLGAMVNTSNPEYLPCLTADDQLLLFTRRINDDRAPEGQQDNLYYTVRDSERNWQVAVPLEGVNSVFNEGAASISADGNTLVFTACSFYGDYGPGRTGMGSCDLFISAKKGSGWSTPENIGKSINTSNWESQPSISADGNTLYFIRAPKKRGKSTNQEIYMSKRTEDGTWSLAEKLPKGINTDYREETVLIHPDGHTLYFSSNGHPGMGGLDIFMTRKDENGEWGEVKNLGYPINTPSDENSLLVSTSGELAYFSSNMEGGYGSFDLYSFELYPEARPLPVTYMKGKVFDKENKSPLKAHFELVDLEKQEIVYSSYSDPLDGGFLIPITYGRNYALNAEHEGYLFFSEHFELKENIEGKPYEMDVPLMKLELGSEVVLRNVFFETDKYDLKDESKIELNHLVTMMMQNPSIRIEVEGHTDDQGSKAHNIDLSTARANTVYQYLIASGISADRLMFKGYADERPLSDNSTEEGRANNRRTSVRIIAK